MRYTNTKQLQDWHPFDDEKYNILFEDLYAPLCRYCNKMVNNAEAAEDIVQEVFIYLWVKWDRIQNIDSITSYLYKAVKNSSLNHLKKQYIKTKFVDIEEYTISNNLIESLTAIDLLECRELELLLEKAIASLPEKCRDIFSMKRFAGMSNLEIAQFLNISVKTVEAQMTIALKKLIAFISKYSQNSSFILYCLFIKD